MPYTSLAELQVAGNSNTIDLRCTSPAIDPIYRGNADMIYPLAHCNQGNVVFGYSVDFSTGGFAGFTTAKVNKINQTGRSRVATLMCRSVRE